MKNVTMWMVAVALGLTACGADNPDDDGFRDAEQLVEEAAQTQQELQDAVTQCQEDFEGCVNGGGDFVDCADDLHLCLTELPDVDVPDIPDIPIPDPPDIPDIPDLPDLGDGFGADCLDGLRQCLDGGGDPATCADEANVCFEDGLADVCDQAHQACLDAGAPVHLCDSITANCV